MSEELVVVASSWSYVDAHIIKGKLEYEGIDAYIANEAIATAHLTYAVMDGGVKVQVRASDAERARAILYPELKSSR